MICKKGKLVGILVIVLLLLCSGIGFASGGEKMEITFTAHVDPTHVIFTILDRLKGELEEKSNGRIFVRILGTEIGGERDQLEGTSVGEYEFTLGGSMPMSLYAPDFSAADVPFAFPNREAAEGLYQGEIGELINERFIKNGNIRLVGLSPRNPRCLTANVPVKTPEALTGRKMRVPEIEPFLRVWKQLGALPTPIAWPEVFLSLQTGVIEMQENPVDVLYAGNLYEVQKYAMKTNHVYSFFHWLVNEDFYKSLSSEDKELIFGTIDEVIAWGREYVDSLTDEKWESLEKDGMQIIEPDLEAFIKKATPEIKNILNDYNPKVKEYVLSFMK